MSILVKLRTIMHHSSNVGLTIAIQFGGGGGARPTDLNLGGGGGGATAPLPPCSASPEAVMLASSPGPSSAWRKHLVHTNYMYM